MYKKNVRLLSIFNFLIGFSLFAPLAIIYFSKVSGSYTLGASIFGITMLASAIFEVPTGILSDRVGRKYTTVLGSWARVIAFVFYALGFSYWFLVIGAIFEGLSRAFYSGNNDALLYDTLQDEHLEGEYQEHLGKVSSTEHTALALSALLGSIIASISFSYLIWISLILQIGMLYVSYQFVEPHARKRINTNVYAHTKEAIALFVKNKKLRLLSLASMLAFAVGEMKYQFRAVFINTLWPLWAVGLANVLSNIGASLSYYFSGGMIKKFGEVNILLFRSLYGKITGFISYGFPNVLSPFIISTPSVFYGVGNIAENKLMQREFTDHQRATMSSLNSLGGSVGFFLMSLLLGSLSDALGPAKALLLMTIVELPTVFIYWLLFHRDTKITI